MLAEAVYFDSQLLPPELLRESHHRITNHLALLVAMIRAQNAAIKQGPAVLTREVASGLLNEISANVVAMAHLHRQFVRHPASATVDLGDLLVECCREIMVSLGLKDRVRFRHTLESSCQITSDEAPSLSLLLSEIVMNAIKYARPDGSLLEIDVSCGLNADGHPAVVISDNGKGLPTNFDAQQQGGFGFRIIRALAQKLQASLTTESSNFGLTYYLLLPARASHVASGTLARVAN